MKKRTAAFVLALLMLLPLALSGCGQTAEEPGAELSGELAGVDMEPVQWSFACHAGSTSSYYLMECDFADAVRERTNGLVDITVYASGELPYQGTEFARCVSDGTLEMAAAPFSYISGECPACGVVGWPLLAGEVDELAVAVEAADPYINNELNAMGITVVGYTSAPMQTMFGVGETPHSLADLNGRKLRTFDAYQPEIVAHYGMSAVAMAIPEVLPSMSKNVIDCALTGTIAAADVKRSDTCTWAYLIPMSASGDIVMINTELLNSLPEEIQTIILEEADNLTKANEEFAATSVDSAIEELEANGCEVVFPTEEEVAEMTELAKGYWDKWIQDYDQNTKDCLAAVRAAVGK